MNTAMKWILGIALVAASASIIVPALWRYTQSVRADGLAAQQEFASF
jgi:hypothetical protein